MTARQQQQRPLTCALLELWRVTKWRGNTAYATEKVSDYWVPILVPAKRHDELAKRLGGHMLVAVPRARMEMRSDYVGADLVGK